MNLHPRHFFKRLAWFAAMIVAVAVAHRLSGGLLNRDVATDSEVSVADAEKPKLHAVTINAIQPPLGATTDLLGHNGEPVNVACQTCHSIRPANAENRLTSDLNEFHQGLKFNHGTLACVACHNAGDNYATLHLADGKSVAYEDAMTLCAQCHGSQFRDYQHGSHGGMTGYWDLTRGPRQRNQCINCHDAHSPQYPVVRPAEMPRDRFPPARKGPAHE